jgi:hypothetical protein
MIKNIFKLLYVLIKIKHFLNDFKGVFFFNNMVYSNEFNYPFTLITRAIISSGRKKKKKSQIRLIIFINMLINFLIGKCNRINIIVHVIYQKKLINFHNI